MSSAAIDTTFGQASMDAVDALDPMFANMESDVADRVSGALYAGLLNGTNPHDLAGQLVDCLSPARATTIARTEMLGAYRTSALDAYRANSDVVGQWMWSSARGGACIACLEMDGEVFSLDEEMDGMTHPNCRCSPIPITSSWGDILGPLGIDSSDIADVSILDDYQTGAEWFAQQDAATQIDALGSKSAYEAVQAGEVSPRDFVGVDHSEQYGDTIYTKSLKEALTPTFNPAAIEQYQEGLSELDQLLADLRAGRTTEAEQEVAELPEPPLATVERAHLSQMRAVQDFAQAEGMSVEEYEQAVSAHLQDLMSEAEVSIRVPEDRLSAILDDGRFKAVGEAGNASPNAIGTAASNAAAQARTQETMFGYALDMPAQDRPIYGYLTSGGEDIPGASAYGDARVILKDEATERTTFITGDSDGAERLAVARPVLAPQWDAVRYSDIDREMMFESDAQKWAAAHDPLRQQSLNDLVRSTYSEYLEAQVHGGVQLSDIDRILFDKAPSQALQDKLERAGIKWSVQGEASVAPARISELDKELRDAQAALQQAVRSSASEQDIYAAKWDVAIKQAAVDTENGGRGAAIFINNANDPLDTKPFENTMQDLFGRPLTRDEIGGIVGAPEGSFINVYVTEQEDSLSFATYGRGWDPMQRTLEPDFTSIRYIDRDAQGNLYVSNSSFKVKAGLQGQGLGARIFADQVDTLSQLDVRYIETHAVGDGVEAALGGSNGYYTWPRFGYDGPLPAGSITLIRDAIQAGDLPSDWADFRSIQEVMDAPGGRDWWKVNGRPLQLRFDLTEGSYSRRTLEDYIRERGALPLQGGEQAAAGGQVGEDALHAQIERLVADATVKDAQDWLASQLLDASQLDLSSEAASTRAYLLRADTVATRVDLTALDQQTAQLVANTSANLAQALPQVLRKLYGIEAHDTYSEALAMVPRDGRTLVINPEKWRDLPQLAANASQHAADGWWVAQTPEQIIAHEFGHLVQLNSDISNDTWIEAMDRVAAAGGNPLVSTYAGDAVEESFGETFALLIYGTPTDAQLPIEREMAQLLSDNGIDYNTVRQAVGSPPLDLGSS